MQKIYEAGLYMRLSKDDESLQESESIQMQRKMLRIFAEENGFIVYKEYVDDGWSGTSFERPAFKQMLNDIENKKINMVITKDLSRLGRNYIIAGQYTEIYFPKHNVRYIAINDKYDSLEDNDDIVSFKHIINEMYAHDISKKIRSSFAVKMKQGEYIGNFAPYGYAKDPFNKNHLIVDYQASIIVKKIFDMAENGCTPSETAEFLNSNSVMTPAVYRCFKMPHLDINNYSRYKKWTSSMICKMLKNIVYLGHTAQGKTSKVSFKRNEIIVKPKDEWILVKNTHTPLINQHTYDIIQGRYVTRKSTEKKNFKNIFSGIAKCMDCGYNMSITEKKLTCGRYKMYGKKACSNHFIEYSLVYNLIFNEFKRYILFLNIENICLNIDKKCSEFDLLKKRKKEIELTIKKIYYDRGLEKIDDDMFENILKIYTAEYKDISFKLKILKENIGKNSICILSEFKVLNSKLLNICIEKIDIGQKNEKYQFIHICYRFKNVFK